MKMFILRNVRFNIIVSLTICLTLSNISYASPFNNGAYVSYGKMDLIVNEIVYTSLPTNSDYKLSHLIWQANNAPLIIIGYHKTIDDFLSVNFEARTLNGSSKAVMDDYDWLYTNISDWSHWSHHNDTKLVTADTYDISLALSLMRGSSSNVSILAGYKKDTVEWNSFGGSYVYSSANNFRDISGNFQDGVAAIDYKQEYTTPYYGIQLEQSVNNWLLGFKYVASRYVGVSSIDLHHARNLLFTETYNKTKMSAYKFDIGYQFNEHFVISYTYENQSFTEARGDMAYSDTSTGASLGSCISCAGTDNSSTTSSIEVDLSF